MSNARKRVIWPLIFGRYRNGKSGHGTRPVPIDQPSPAR